VTRLLRIRIDESWPGPAHASWVLLARDGTVLGQGEGEPGQWPPADDHEAILSAPQAAWLRARLPAKAPRREAPRLLAYALEDQLLREPDSQHFTVTGRQGDEVSVLVTARERLRAIVTRFVALGRPLSGLYSELQTAPAGTDGWHLTLAGDGAILRMTGQSALPLDLDPRDPSPPPMLANLLAEYRRHQDVVPVLVLHGAPSHLPDVPAWAAALDVETRVGPPPGWYRVGNGADNLLTGEFAPRHRHRAWLARIRPALLLAGLVLVADVLLGAAQVGWWHHRLADQEDGIRSLFRGAFPNTPVVDPAAQVERQLDLLRMPLGRLRGDDALLLLSAVADGLGADGAAAVQVLRYDEGRLELTLAPGLAGRADALASALALRGIATTSRLAATGALQITVRRRGRS
jgi:general secretion pathway protein L